MTYQEYADRVSNLRDQKILLERDYLYQHRWFRNECRTTWKPPKVIHTSVLNIVNVLDNNGNFTQEDALKLCEYLDPTRIADH